MMENKGAYLNADLLPHPKLGNLIRQRAEALGMSQSELGRRMSMERQNIGEIYKKDRLNTEQLHRFCIVLGFNFFVTFCGEKREKVDLKLLDKPQSGMTVSLDLPTDPKMQMKMVKDLQRIRVKYEEG